MTNTTDDKPEAAETPADKLRRDLDAEWRGDRALERKLQEARLEELGHLHGIREEDRARCRAFDEREVERLAAYKAEMAHVQAHRGVVEQNQAEASKRAAASLALQEREVAALESIAKSLLALATTPHKA